VKHRAWLVDLDGTLYRPRPVRLCMAAELLVAGIPALPVVRAFRREHERLRAELDGDVESPYELQLAHVAKRLGRDVGDLRGTLEEWMLERPCKWLRRFARRELLAEIGAFRGAGGRTALVSDYPARVKLAALEATELFDVVVASGEPGGPRRLKPHPDGFLAAARELAVEPAGCLVLGDRRDADGAAAARAGMEFRWVR